MYWGSLCYVWALHNIKKMSPLLTYRRVIMNTAIIARNKLVKDELKEYVKDLKDLMEWVVEREQFLKDIDKRMEQLG